MMIWTTIFTVVTTLLFSTVYTSDPCRFEYPGKGVIDITSLGRTDGKPTYADGVSSTGSNYRYSYNPCKPFSEGSGCQNVSVCRLTLDKLFSFPLGVQDSASWYPGSATSIPAVIYTYQDNKIYVALQCSTDGTDKFEVISDDTVSIYIFRLTHKCACWDGCASTTTTMTPTTGPPSMNPCRFEHAEKGVIDLSFIGRTDEKAMYTNETTRAASNFKYSYNPCRSFSQGTSCIGVSVCQISKDDKYTFTLGTQESASWSSGADLDGVPSIHYAYGDKKVNVLLQCSPEGNHEFQAFGEDPINNYVFQLTHKCACWNGCSYGFPTTTASTTTSTSSTTTITSKSKWHITGSMNETRFDHTATLLGDGTVLVAGGGTRHFLTSAELYDPSTGTWMPTGSLNEERAGHSASLLTDGKVLIAGGGNFHNDHLTSAELYDPLTRTWAATGSLNEGRTRHTATLLTNGKVLVTGGYTSQGGHLSSTELYDPSTGTWTVAGNMSKARTAHTATLLGDGKVLVAGGDEGKYEGSLTSVELFDPSTETWTATSSMIYGQEYHTASLLANGKVLLVGGFGNFGPITSAQLYDSSTAKWSTTGAMDEPRAYHTASILDNGLVLVTGGTTGSDYLNSAELYNPYVGLWSATDSMKKTRQQHTACNLANGKVLVSGGPLNTDVVEVYTPLYLEYTKRIEIF